jgi:hypothetical protein
MRKSVLASAALALITSAVLADLGPRAEAAATCSGTGCDGIPAASTTCVNGAYVVYSDDYYTGGSLAGNLQLKYSPSCRTTWGRVVSYIGDRGGALVVGHWGDFGCDIPGGATGCNTGMSYDAGEASYASATIYDSRDAPYTWRTASY